MRLIACIGAVAVLSSCGVTVPDPQGCLQLTRGDAYCRNLFTERPVRKSVAQWSKEKIGTICYAPDDVGKLIKFIEEVCQRGQNCVSDWETRLEQSMDNMNVVRK
jgi:hypothetical protein